MKRKRQTCVLCDGGRASVCVARLTLHAGCVVEAVEFLRRVNAHVAKDHARRIATSTECFRGHKGMTRDEAKALLDSSTRGTIGEFQDAQIAVVAAGHTDLVTIGELAWIERIRRLEERKP